ncbi:hypothetical protein ABZX56_34760, partial [Streptomyces parvulus]
MNPLRNAVNRTLLALTGAALLAGGGWLALGGSGTADRLPTWWPRPEDGTALLDRARLADWRRQRREPHQPVQPQVVRRELAR